MKQSKNKEIIDLLLNFYENIDDYELYDIIAVNNLIENCMIELYRMKKMLDNCEFCNVSIEDEYLILNEDGYTICCVCLSEQMMEEENVSDS